MSKNFRVNVMDSERGWGRDFWDNFHETLAEALADYKSINDLNKPGPAPDYYIQANGIEQFDEDSREWVKIR